MNDIRRNGRGGWEPRRSLLEVCLVFILIMLSATSLSALPQFLGDLDEDGRATVLDLARLQNHLRRVDVLNATHAFFADVNEDGFANEADVTALANVILGLAPLKEFPLARVREASPADGEGGVSVNRETIFHLTLPLGSNALVNTTNLFATFGGRKILSRVEMSTDHKTVTLFYLEPVPASARVRVTFNGSALTDFLGRPMDLDGDGLPGGSAKVDFDTLSITPVSGTAVIGHVYASEPLPGTNSTNFVNLPLQGVLVSVDGAEESLWTRTDVSGYFRLQPVPAGRFFVHVDGRSAVGSHWPSNVYYPVVGKAWEAVAGRTNNLAGGSGEIFLPLIQAGSLQSVSATNETIITFAPSVLASNPWLAGVSIEVPANSLFSDNGTRGGMVGIAPVPPDRLPEPLPPGLNFPLVITVQTDGGLNFDRPVPVRFPNLPDPVTGLLLPPGAKSALWSFNHDKGSWEIVGPMTVTADGFFLESDPGVGIRQPGWHGVQEGTQGDGDPPPDMDKDKEKKCKEVSDAELARIVVNAVTEVAECAGFFWKKAKIVYDSIKCVSSSVNGLWKTYNEMNARIEELRRDPSLGNDVITSMRVACTGLEGGLDALSKCFEGAVAGGAPPTPIDVLLSEFEPVLVCTGNFLSIVNSVCKATAPGPDDPPECQRGLLLKIACGSADVAKQGVDAVKLRLNDLKGEFGKLQINALKLASRNLCRLVPAPQGTQISPASASTDVINIDEIQAALKEVLAASAPFLQATSFGDESAQSLATVEAALLSLQTDSGAALASATLPLDAPFFWAIQSVQQILRGSSEGGAFRVILPPNGPYELYIFNPRDNTLATASGVSGPSGSRTKLPTALLRPTTDAPDADHDGLADVSEFCVGTDPNKTDSDGDGVSDLAELRSGTNPLDGLPATIGVIAASETPGNAVDVCAVNDLAIVADSLEGVVILNIADRKNLTRIAQVNTPGNARAVACSGNFVAVADDTNGLAVIDITDPPAAQIVHQLRLGGVAQAVAVDGAVAYVGLGSGVVVAVDIASGTVLNHVRTSSAVQDLALDGGLLYILNSSTLQVATLADSDFRVITTVSAPGSGANPRRRLFVGGGLAYASHQRGYNIFRLTSPTMPVLQRDVFTTQFGWHQIVANGSGLGVAAMGVNASIDSSHDVWLYSLNPNGTNSQFLTSLPTPGAAYAVSIYNGLAYAADGANGLQVINYVAYDSQGVSPTIQLTPNFTLTSSTNGAIEEGQIVRLTANVTDDVQVGVVEFYVNGQRVLTDGNFPFEHRFVAPALNSGASNFTVRARAVDTGGNATWSDEIAVTLLPDMTPPRLSRTFPIHAGIIGGVDLVGAYFSEPINPDALSASTFQLVSAGPDGILQTGDDFQVTGGTLSYREELKAAFLTFNTNLASGFYQAQVSPPIADRAGNVMTNSYTWFFWVVPGNDADQDGVPDDVELAIGLNPQNPDSNGNGIWDGDEDSDLDGLPNKWEVVFGYNPLAADSNGNGVRDDAEDLDGDGLLNRDEIIAGTNPRSPDTDRDGWNDETEITYGSSPFDPTDFPRWYQVARPPVQALLPSADDPNLLVNVAVARPPVRAVLPSLGDANSPANTTAARPPVRIVVPGIGDPNFPANTALALPPVRLVLPSSSDPGLPANVSIALPPVKVGWIVGPVTNSANGHRYYLLPPATWADAEMTAVQLSGHLATINDQAEQDWIVATFARDGVRERDLWSGFRDPDPLNNAATRVTRMGEFAWVSGQAVTYQNWLPGQPDNFGSGEFFALLISAQLNTWATTPNWRWNDAGPGAVAYGVVEVEP